MLWSCVPREAKLVAGHVLFGTAPLEAATGVQISKPQIAQHRRPYRAARAAVRRPRVERSVAAGQGPAPVTPPRPRSRSLELRLVGAAHPLRALPSLGRSPPSLA